jgi:hypothetical protein
LDVARRLDARTDGRRGLAPRRLFEILKRHWRGFDVQINAIHQRPTEARTVFLDLLRRADTLAPLVHQVPARARVHRHDEEKSGRETQRHGRATDSHHPILKGLTKNLEGRAGHFRHLVQEQDAIVRDRNFTRVGDTAPAYQRRSRDGVVGRSKRAGGHQRLTGVQQTGDTVDFGGFQAFIQTHAGQNGGEPFGQHGFTAAGTADQEHVVHRGGGNFERALGVALPFYVLKVHVVILVLAENLFSVNLVGCQGFVAGKEANDLGQRETASTSIPSTIAASAALASGTSRPRRPASRTPLAMERTPGTGRIAPSSPNSPTSA